ncbi:hypothetical protein IFM89_039317 [Coptis chinensis]|uniref:beta-ketoacyl-[acyl-carrier-protein] synthase I n=1 Tax=Coptis chinensis TaxID=261450 RepID=A0A835HTE2_9MAGN|nr:hypothetical protein IFM89_039317 [Coptis chinensis]
MRHSILLEKLRARHLKDSSKIPLNKAPSFGSVEKQAGDDKLSKSRKVGNTKVFTSFRELGLDEEVMGAVDELGISVPTEIQGVGIPVVLEGKSVVLGSHTLFNETKNNIMPNKVVRSFSKNVHSLTLTKLDLRMNSLSITALRARPVRAINSTTSTPEREKDPKKRVVITGMGLVSVFGNDVTTFYDRLLAGESGISLIDRFDASTFSVRFAGQICDFSSEGYIDGKSDHRLDDCWRYCIVAGKKALEDASLRPGVLDTMDKSKIGVLVGTGMGGLSAFSSGVESLTLKGFKKISLFFIPYSITNMGSALLAMH